MPDPHFSTRPAPGKQDTLSDRLRRALTTTAARRALAERDITTVYRLLTEADISQRQIAQRTGQSQSEVSEVLKGRRVMAYDVLVRVAQGLEVPRSWMGLAYDEGAESMDPAVGEEVIDEDMRRRALLAAASVALFGAPVLGEVLQLPTSPTAPTPLPSRLGASDVAALKELTARLRTVARSHGGGADVLTAVANRSRPLMSVPAPEPVKAELGSALADLHTLAGWCCVDSGLNDQARACFVTAMDFAAGAGDYVQMASAFWHAGIHMRDAGAYNDDLKACQLGLIKLGEALESPQAAEVTAWLHAESARAFAAMGHSKEAERSLKTAREWQPTTIYDDADMEHGAASVYLLLGRLDTAQRFAVSSVRKWSAEGTSRREGVAADMALATIHTQAGQSNAAELAERAIAGMAPLQSLRTRRIKLAPLIKALDARADSTSCDLAHRARQLAGSA
ncbi:MAG: helix-turn-helix domain-containing protein [Pseudonocardiaceae bacterium]